MKKFREAARRGFPPNRKREGPGRVPGLQFPVLQGLRHAAEGRLRRGGSIKEAVEFLGRIRSPVWTRFGAPNLTKRFGAPNGQGWSF